MTMTLPEDPLEMHTQTVGAPKLAGVAGETVDPARPGDLCVYATADPITGELLPPAAEGELTSRGPTRTRGYWAHAEETAATLVDGRVCSGDAGRIRDDGYLQITGRSKELYKSGGELVMPKEIEELLTQHPGVSQAYAVGIPDDRWGEVGCAYVVPEPGSTVTEEELLEVCRAKLGRFKVPKHVVFLAPAELPAPPTGKVQIFRLAARFRKTVS